MQNDYIIRIIQQFTLAILSIVRARKAGDNKEAREIVRTTARYLLQVDVDLLLFYDPNQILDYFKDFSDRLETEKCALAADLLLELALIEESEKNLVAARSLKILSLYLYTVAIPKEPKFQNIEYFEKVESLIKELQGQTFPEKTLESLLSYREFLEPKIV